MEKNIMRSFILLIFNKYYCRDQLKEDEMSRIYSTREGLEIDTKV
jgi:hypothetical protein